MKARALGNAAIASLLFVFAGCGKDEESAKGSAPATSPAAKETSETATDTAARAGTAERPPEELILGVSVNSAKTTEVFKGWPVVVEAVIRLTPHAKGPKTVTGADGPWSDALRLACTGPDGKDCSSLFQSAFPSKPSIELTRERSGLAVWILEDAQLPPGTYSLRVTIDAARVGNTVPEGLRSNRATLTVSGAAPGPEAETRKVRATIDAALYKGDAARALAAVDAHLAKNPKDTLILARKGQILRSQGKREEALAALEAALAMAREAKGDVRPLLRQVDELREEMRAK